MKRLSILIIVLVIILYFQYGEINKEINEFDILQYKNPDKDMIEKILFEKKISIITDLDLDKIQYNERSILFVTPSVYKSLTDEEQTKILRLLKQYFSYYYLPLNIKSDISLNYEKRGTKTALKLQKNYRFCISQILGSRKLVLFPPNSKNDLYYNKKTGIFEVDFWNQNIITHPNVEKAKYIEILLHPGQAIFIPNNWIFCYTTEDNSMSVSFYSESIFSSVLKF